MENVDLRSLSPDARASLKRVAIRLFKKGDSKSSIARDLGLRRATVSEWLLAYEATGRANYQEKKRGRPTGYRQSYR